MMRIRVGLVLILGLLAAVPSSAAASGSATPVTGNWEGTGSHGLPLSFALASHRGRLVATSLAVGSPASCPAVSRDAAAVPLRSPVYAGPGSGLANGGVPSASPAVLSGQVPQSGHRVSVRGSFLSPQSGTFVIQIQKRLGCGWPATTLTWTVHRARRRPVGAGTWTGPLTADGLVNANVRLVVGAQGRVVDSFTSFFTCLTDTQEGNTTFRAVPAFNFVRPNGSFYSPLNGGLVRGHATSWSGRFSRSGRLTGTLSIFDDCTNQLIRARFAATRTKPA